MSLKSIGELTFLFNQFISGSREIEGALAKYSTQSIIAAAATKKLSLAQLEEILYLRGLEPEEINAAIATSSFASAQNTATVATGGLSATLKGLWAVMLANPIASITAALLAGAIAFTQWKKHSEEAIREAQQAANDSSQAYSDTVKSLDEYKTKLAELREEID